MEDDEALEVLRFRDEGRPAGVDRGGVGHCGAPLNIVLGPKGRGGRYQRLEDDQGSRMSSLELFDLPNRSN